MKRDRTPTFWLSDDPPALLPSGQGELPFAPAEPETPCRGCGAMLRPCDVVERGLCEGCWDDDERAADSDPAWSAGDEP